MSADFFDGIYARAGDDADVPWQQAISRRFIGEWFENFQPSGEERAIVVAAGLGDDAASLAARGLDVVAFDFSPAAVDWAKRRHADAKVEWHVADLFDTPSDWSGAFDLVLEVFTIQSIRPSRQPRAAAAIKSLLSPAGRLVAVTLVHDGASEPEGPPWPIHPTTLDELTAGLSETARATEHVGGGTTCVRVELTRAQ